MQLKDCNLGLIVFQKGTGGYDESGVSESVRVGHIVGLTIYNGKTVPVVQWAKQWPWWDDDRSPVNPRDIDLLKYME